MRTTKRSVATVVLATVVMIAAACIPPPEAPKPQLTLPANITVEATSANGAVVTLEATALDREDGPLPVTCTPASGSLFVIGTTVVRCSATNSQGGTRNGRFDVTVTPLGGTTTTTTTTTTASTTTTTQPTTTTTASTTTTTQPTTTTSTTTTSTTASTTTTTQPTTTTSTTTTSTTASTTTTTQPTTTTASTTTTTQPPGTVPGISAGYNHTCAVRTDGTVRCWGANGQGQIGLGTGNLSTRILTPTTVLNLTNVSAIAAGGFHTCAISGGLVFCWGSASFGQTGGGGPIPASPIRTPVQVAGLSNVVSIAAGQFHTCAVRANGTMACWGDGFDGQLGTGISGGSYASSVPVNVTGVSNAVEVTAGFGHTCIRRSNNTASCWGANNNGQLGNGEINGVDDPPVASPVNVQLSNVTSIRAGFGFTCGVADGLPRCWGENVNGNLGGGTLLNAVENPLLVPLTPLTDDVLDASLVVGGGDHACARRVTGAVRCWGLNLNGQLGINSTTSSLIRNSDGQPTGFRQPVDVSGLSNVAAVVTGEEHSCVRRNNGTVACWGYNDAGQLGNGNRTRQLVPVEVTGI